MRCRSLASRGRPLILLAAVTLLVEGCVVIPHQADGSRRTIGEDRARFLRPAVATREEVLLTLGEPEDVLDGEKVFVYRWARAVTIIGPQIEATHVTGRHGLRIEFDDLGRLKAVERSERECRGWLTAQKGECK